MFSEKLPIHGQLLIELFGPDGELKDRRVLNNLIVQAGKNFVAAAILNASPTPFTSIAIGTSGTAPVNGDTALGAEVARVVFGSASAPANVITMMTTFIAGVGTGTLQEAGIFNDPTAGTMLSHVIFAPVTKGALDTLTIIWTVTVG